MAEAGSASQAMKDHRHVSLVCLILAVVTLLTYGCATTLPPVKATYSFDRRCTPVNPGLKAILVSDVEPASIMDETGIHGEAARLYSATAIYIAEIMDLLPLLNRLARLEKESTNAAEIDRARRKLTTRIQLATMEVSSLVAEIECEVQRADEVQDRLKQAQTKRTTFQTILAVVFGGVTNVITGGLGLATGAGDTAHIVTVLGGTMEVLFGTSANFVKVRQEFSHPRNHLEALLDNTMNNDYFSPRVWRFLTQPDMRDLEGHSLRDVLLQAWREEGRLGESGSRREQERESLIFGPGGLYDADDLHIREAMLQQLEASIQLMHQDLENLLREVLIRQAMEN
jgi:hypothetical protein